MIEECQILFEREIQVRKECAPCTGHLLPIPEALFQLIRSRTENDNRSAGLEIIPGKNRRTGRNQFVGRRHHVPFAHRAEIKIRLGHAGEHRIARWNFQTECAFFLPSQRNRHQIKRSAGQTDHRSLAVRIAGKIFRQISAERLAVFLRNRIPSDDDSALLAEPGGILSLPVFQSELFQKRFAIRIAVIHHGLLGDGKEWLCELGKHIVDQPRCNGIGAITRSDVELTKQQIRAFAFVLHQSGEHEVEPAIDDRFECAE